MIGFTFNNIHSNVYNIIAKSVNRPLLPTLRKNEMVIPGRDGVIDFFDNTFDKRLISVDMKYVGTSLENLRANARLISSWINTCTSTKTLSFDDEPDKYYNCRIYNQLDLNNLFTLAQTSIQFECEPLSYATASYTFGWTTTSSSMTISCSGTYSANVTFEIVGSIINPIIINETTIKIFTLSAMITAGSTTTINSELFTVEVNGVNFLNKYSGDFIDFVQRKNILLFSCISANATVNITWKNRWL